MGITLFSFPFFFFLIQSWRYRFRRGIKDVCAYLFLLPRWLADAALLTVDSSTSNSMLYRPRGLFFLAKSTPRTCTPCLASIISYLLCTCPPSPPSNLNQFFSSLATTSIRTPRPRTHPREITHPIPRSPFPIPNHLIPALYYTFPLSLPTHALRYTDCTYRTLLYRSIHTVTSIAPHV